MNVIYLTPTCKRIYSALYEETGGGKTEFVGHLRVPPIDHGQLSREIRRLVKLGAIASESIDPSHAAHGRRMRILVEPEWIEVVTRGCRKPPQPITPKPMRAERECDEAAMATRDRQFARFDNAWRAAFPHGADYRRGAYVLTNANPHDFSANLVTLEGAPISGVRA